MSSCPPPTRWPSTRSAPACWCTKCPPGSRISRSLTRRCSATIPTATPSSSFSRPSRRRARIPGPPPPSDAVRFTASIRAWQPPCPDFLSAVCPPPASGQASPPAARAAGGLMFFCFFPRGRASPRGCGGGRGRDARGVQDGLVVGDGLVQRIQRRLGFVALRDEVGVAAVRVERRLGLVQRGLG